MPTVTYKFTEEDLRKTADWLEYEDIPYFEKLHNWLHRTLHTHFGRKYCWLLNYWPTHREKSRWAAECSKNISEAIDDKILQDLERYILEQEKLDKIQ